MSTNPSDTNIPVLPPPEPQEAAASGPLKRSQRRIPDTLQRVPVASAIVVVAAAVGMVLGFALGHFGGADTGSGAATPSRSASPASLHRFSDAITKCGLVSTSESASISDNGRTMTIENRGENDTIGLDTTDMWCLIRALGAPQAVISHMEQTTSMDGRQTETWGDIAVSWSYHPDRGMDSIFTEK